MVNSFYTDVLSKNPEFHSLNRQNSLSLLEPNFRAKIIRIVAKASLKIPVVVLETYRSCERQEQLFKEHATQLEKVGVHHYGLAVDIVKLVMGEPSFKGDFSFLGPLAKAENLIWGYDWGQPNIEHSFRDIDHIQAISVKDQNKLFDGSWYPDASYNPYENL